MDPFLRAPVGEGPGYFRLHGRPASNHRYRYSHDDLQRLAGWLQQRRSARVRFNNDTMADAARRLKALLETG